MPLLTSLEPIRVVEGARLWLRGEGFPLPNSTSDIVTIGGVPARLSFAGTDRVAVLVPAGLRGGEAPVKVTWVPGATLFARIGALVATGLHQVDNPVFGPDGSLYVTYSGVRGQESAVSVFRVGASGAREPFVRGMVNPTSMAFGPDRRLYISSRFDGRVYRVFEDGRYEVFASDLGLACGLAFGGDGTIFVGDRSGTIFRIDENGHVEKFATVPASVAAFHMAMGPDGSLYVSAPTLSTYDSVYRIDADARIETLDALFGRPQGLAFDPSGVLHVVEALAGSSGVYALRPGARRELIVAGNNLVGVAFDPAGHIVVAANDSVLLRTVSFMIVAVAALLFAASLSVGLRATSGWLEHWHPIDRLILAMVLGGVMLAASITLSSRFGVIQAGYGLAFSLAPVGVYDLLRWWFRSRGRRSPWLLGATAAGWVVALRWLFLVAMAGGVAALAAAPPAQ